MDKWTWIWKRAVLQWIYDDNLDLITHDQSPVNESEVESDNDSGPQEKNSVGS